jgi:DsbC/DsbD-like thiol-disulfide interchange protein
MIRRLGVMMLLAASAVAAQARPQIGNGVKHASATVEPITVTAHSATFLVTLHVEPGWHVSWRNPGETGLPTRLSWSLPVGVHTRAETWPVPLIQHTAIGATHTLEGDVPWIVDMAIDSASTSDRLLVLTMRYGVCKNVCIPEQISVQAALPARAMSNAAVVTPALRARLATDLGVLAARRVSPTMLCVQGTASLARAPLPELVADSGSGVDAAAPVTASGRGARATVRAAIPAAAALRTDARVLFVRGVTAASARLDFRKPAPGCAIR